MNVFNNQGMLLMNINFYSQGGNQMHCTTCGASQHARLNSTVAGEPSGCNMCNSPRDHIEAAAKTRFALQFRKERRVTFMMGATFALSMLCRLPVSILYMVNCYTNVTLSTAMIACIWLLNLNSASSIMYFVCNPDFRRAFQNSYTVKNATNN